MAVPADSLAPDRVESLLRGRLGRPYLYREECESTQLMLDDPELPEGALALCERQRSGRGRMGRTWQAPAGTSILCSVLLRPPPDRRPAELSLVAGVAVADMVERELDLAVQIKWPNDVMVRRTKVAGLLGEVRGGAVVLGVGLNVNQAREELPADARQQPGSLRTVDGAVRERAPLLAALLLDLERRYDEWLAGGLDALYVALGPRDFLRGREVAVDGLHGVAVGIDRAGRLELELAHGERRAVESGEVSYER